VVVGLSSVNVVAENVSSERIAELIGVTPAELAALEDEKADHRRELIARPLPPVTAYTLDRVAAIRAGMAEALTPDEANRRWFKQRSGRGS
jgi:hypothetical protein